MNQTAQLKTLLAAHAILLQVAKGTTLGPLIILENRDGTSQIIRIQEATRKSPLPAREILQANATGRAERGVMSFDAYLNLPQGRSDAIFLQAHVL